MHRVLDGGQANPRTAGSCGEEEVKDALGVRIGDTGSGVRNLQTNESRTVARGCTFDVDSSPGRRVDQRVGQQLDDALDHTLAIAPNHRFHGKCDVQPDVPLFKSRADFLDGLVHNTSEEEGLAQRWGGGCEAEQLRDAGIEPPAFR
jgi:hypothetical protein